MYFKCAEVNKLGYETKYAKFMTFIVDRNIYRDKYVYEQLIVQFNFVNLKKSLNTGGWFVLEIEWKSETLW